jgi:hypothetical protein
MDHLFKLKNTFIEYLSPKRRRTVGPATPPHTGNTAEHSYVPASEPKDKKTKAAVGGRINQKYLSPSDTRFARGSLKRPREDDEYADEDDFEVSPDESISQVTPAQRSEHNSVASTTSEDEESEISVVDLENDAISAEDEISAEEKVKEYLNRQAALALRKGAIDEVKAQGTWHHDEVFLFERLSMRSFEELLPASWQIDFPTLPEALFTTDPAKTFIDFNCGSSSRGMAC